MLTRCCGSLYDYNYRVLRFRPFQHRLPPLRAKHGCMGTSTHKPLALVPATNNRFMTNLVCGIQDRLVLYSFDAQHHFEAIPGTIRGLSEDDICMHHSALADFFLTSFLRSGLDRAQEARFFLFPLIVSSGNWLAGDIRFRGDPTYQSSRRRGTDRGCAHYRRFRQAIWAWRV